MEFVMPTPGISRRPHRVAIVMRSSAIRRDARGHVRGPAAPNVPTTSTRGLTPPFCSKNRSGSCELGGARRSSRRATSSSSFRGQVMSPISARVTFGFDGNDLKARIMGRSARVSGTEYARSPSPSTSRRPRSNWLAAFGGQEVNRVDSLFADLTSSASRGNLDAQVERAASRATSPKRSRQSALGRPSIRRLSEPRPSLKIETVNARGAPACAPTIDPWEDADDNAHTCF